MEIESLIDNEIKLLQYFRSMDKRGQALMLHIAELEMKRTEDLPKN